ncbi:MAG TPA: RusA family crossover junction endodeoxyribonuclease [Pelobium sp.]|nr:RusA family crossover junction endodeoxyribonuclease [Pelobium sp.]
MKEEDDESYEIEVNPKIDILFGLYDCPPIPTKQDAYKPLSAFQKNSDGTESILNDIYKKNPDTNSIKEFHTLLREVASKNFPDGSIIKKPTNVEVVISISVTEKRFKTVDVDNLAKAVLDGLNKIAFEDDSQVKSLICSKNIHPMKKNGIFIGVTKLTSENQGFYGDITLYKMKPSVKLMERMEPLIKKYIKANR